MSIESLRIHQAALEEAEAATDWYAQRSRRAAERFLDELDRAIDKIGRNPEQYPSHDFGTRRMVLSRFPFVIVFRTAAAGGDNRDRSRPTPPGLLARTPGIRQARLGVTNPARAADQGVASLEFCSHAPSENSAALGKIVCPTYVSALRNLAAISAAGTLAHVSFTCSVNQSPVGGAFALIPAASSRP